MPEPTELQKYFSDKLADEGRYHHRLITGLSTGSLVLSMIFLKDISHEPTWKWCLITAWILLLVSIASGVVRTERLIRANVLVAKASLSGLTDQQMREIPRYRCLGYILMFAFFGQHYGFLAGIVALTAFVIRNLYHSWGNNLGTAPHYFIIVPESNREITPTADKRGGCC